MARHRRAALKINGQQAREALEFLIHEGKIVASEVTKALERREKLVADLKARLVELGDEGAAAGRRLSKRAAKEWRSSRPARRRAVSAATRAARRAQGEYMAAVRRLSKAARNQIREIRKSSGVRAAIDAARKLAG
jgi:hypothetical protein